MQRESVNYTHVVHAVSTTEEQSLRPIDKNCEFGSSLDWGDEQRADEETYTATRSINTIHTNGGSC